MLSCYELGNACSFMGIKKEIDSEKSISELIIDILEEQDATVKELSKTVNISENVIRTTINRMKDSKLILETGLFRDRYKIYTTKKLTKREEIERAFLERLKNAVLNRDKREAIFRKYSEEPDDIYTEEIDVKAGFFIELLIQKAKEELLEDDEFLEELKEKFKKLNQS